MIGIWGFFKLWKVWFIYLYILLEFKKKFNLIFVFFFSGRNFVFGYNYYRFYEIFYELSRKFFLNEVSVWIVRMYLNIKLEYFLEVLVVYLFEDII